MGGLTTAQRVVVVVAWAGVLWALSTWVFRDGLQYTFGDNEGWYNYAPNSGVVFSGSGPPWWMTNPTARMLADLLVVVLWAVPSFWLLGVRPVEKLHDATDDVDEVD